jgi:hypothetical protein
VFIHDGRISGTRTQSQVSGTPPDGEYVLRPCGFTREDVANLRDTANWLHANPAWGLMGTPTGLFRLADRIEALLPPES